jgi:hypothetical protein
MLGTFNGAGLLLLLLCVWKPAVKLGYLSNSPAAAGAAGGAALLLLSCA